jgi:hypothetical protein
MNRLNLEPPPIIELTNIRPRTDMLACQKQAQSSTYQVRTTLIIGKIHIFNYIILLWQNILASLLILYDIIK